MARTIRRPYKHLLHWWLPNLGPAVTTQDDWRQHRLPKLLYSKSEAQIVRIVQSDHHRFFSGVGRYSRKRYHKQFRQLSRRKILSHVRGDCWDDFVDAKRYFEPYS